MKISQAIINNGLLTFFREAEEGEAGYHILTSDELEAERRKGFEAGAEGCNCNDCGSSDVDFRYHDFTDYKNSEEYLK